MRFFAVLLWLASAVVSIMFMCLYWKLGWAALHWIQAHP